MNEDNLSETNNEKHKKLISAAENYTYPHGFEFHDAYCTSFLDRHYRSEEFIKRVEIVVRLRDTKLTPLDEGYMISFFIFPSDGGLSGAFKRIEDQAKLIEEYEAQKNKNERKAAALSKLTEFEIELLGVKV
ncbi:hypothetical protein [Agarilytica rhodophyticola]|uniref:hypothetical protein n=1 Tax=Agarilytica rhodophyticola TaxID=1737490 RepID=UPI000B34524D|nr:hypothetical protein [Agarilytica rhodophyticola]